MKKYIKDNNGITLVALVVTIIVLLILAGVTITMTISGDSIFQRARNATDAYRAAAKDEEKAITTGISNQIGDYKTKYGYDDATKVTSSNYGWKVTNYVAEGADTLTWRIFWQDSENVYIIADSNIENYSYSSYSNTNISDITRKLNPNWNEEWNNQDNGKSVARLTNKDNWSKYLDKDNIASWAIGAATLDMYIKSYNETHTTAGLTYSAVNGGYSMPSTYTLSQTDNRGIYKGERLIASPVCSVEFMGSVITNMIWKITGSGTIETSGYDSSKGIYPVVAIPKGRFIFEIKDE